MHFVNVADTWRERLRSYPGRAHGHIKMYFDIWLKQDLHALILPFLFIKPVSLAISSSSSFEKHILISAAKV